MKIVSIELKGYLWLHRNNINIIRITPESQMHLILGTNGSGKSSLLKELSPLPAAPAEFSKDGYKLIEISHRNSHYILKSDFSGVKNIFSFRKDTEELNPGGTSASYKELVRIEFGITQEIQNLLTGFTKFSQMDVSERRYWFTKISEADYTYAIQYFKKLSNNYRNLTGAIKLNQERLVREQEKLIGPEEESLLRKEIEGFSALLSDLLEMRSPAGETNDLLANKLSKVDASLTHWVNQYATQRKIFHNAQGYESLQEIENDILEYHGRLHHADQNLAQYFEKIEKLQSTLDSMSSLGLESTGDIDGQIKSLSELIDQLKTEIRLPCVFQNSTASLEAYTAVSDEFLSITNDLPANPGKEINRAYYEKTHADLKSLQAFSSQLKENIHRLQLLQKEQEHLFNHNQLECPACSHKWVKDYNGELHRKLIEDIAGFELTLETTTEHISKTEVLLENASNYLKSISSVLRITNTSQALSSFWQYMMGKEWLWEKPNMLPGLFSDLKGDLERWVKIQEVEKQYTNAVSVKELLVKNQQDNLLQIIQDKDTLTQSLQEEQANARVLKHQLTTLQSYKSAANNSIIIQGQIENLIKDRESLLKLSMIGLERETFNEAIQAIQLEIIRREQIINRVDIHKALVKDIEIQILDMQEDAEMARLAVKELSPSEGLIAKGLTGFINHFLHQMNTFIKTIWLYPMELVPILPDEKDGVDLDYRFAIQSDTGKPTPDVKVASGGMKEIIDMAFRVIAVKYLHLEHAPLFLDEFTANMDHAHKLSAFRGINNIVATANFSQIFIVSHYENSYAGLVNADVTVLCPANLILPKDMVYNNRTYIA